MSPEVKNWYAPSARYRASAKQWYKKPISGGASSLSARDTTEAKRYKASKVGVMPKARSKGSEMAAFMSDRILCHRGDFNTVPHLSQVKKKSAKKFGTSPAWNTAAVACVRRLSKREKPGSAAHPNSPEYQRATIASALDTVRASLSASSAAVKRAIFSPTEPTSNYSSNSRKSGRKAHKTSTSAFKLCRGSGCSPDWVDAPSIRACFFARSALLSCFQSDTCYFAVSAASFFRRCLRTALINTRASLSTCFKGTLLASPTALVKILSACFPPLLMRAATNSERMAVRAASLSTKSTSSAVYVLTFTLGSRSKFLLTFCLRFHTR